MSELSTVISGFGGQGVILAGKILARSGMEADLEVTWLPSYGPEMRGGTANCTVIVDDQLIGSPVVDEPSILLAFNGPSLRKFGPEVEDGGTIILNSSLIDDYSRRDEVNTIEVPLNDLADELNTQKVINMVALGAWAGVNDRLTFEDVAEGMELMLEEGGKGDFVGVNKKALSYGFEELKS